MYKDDVFKYFELLSKGSERLTPEDEKFMKDMFKD